MGTTIFGSVALDSVKTSFGKGSNLLGGSASYASLSASFFNKVDIISIVGIDFPKKYFSLFKEKGINVSSLEQKKGETFKWKAEYNKDMSCAKTLDTKLNVFENFIPKVSDNIDPKNILLLANIDPELQYYVLNKVKSTNLVVCDTMNLWIETKKKDLIKVMKKVDLFLMNEEEAKQFSGEKNLLNAAKFILSKGPKMLVIKKGEHGALFFYNKRLDFVVNAYLTNKAVDPTGAGDTFVGAMVGYISRSKKITDNVLRTSLVYGSILASFTVEDFSANGLLNITNKDLKKRYDFLKKVTRF